MQVAGRANRVSSPRLAGGWRGAGGRAGVGEPSAWREGEGGQEDADAKGSSVGASPKEAGQPPAQSLEGPCEEVKVFKALRRITESTRALRAQQRLGRTG